MSKKPKKKIDENLIYNSTMQKLCEIFETEHPECIEFEPLEYEFEPLDFEIEDVDIDFDFGLDDPHAFCCGECRAKIEPKVNI